MEVAVEVPSPLGSVVGVGVSDKRADRVRAARVSARAVEASVVMVGVPPPAGDPVPLGVMVRGVPVMRVPVGLAAVLVMVLNGDVGVAVAVRVGVLVR
jgi:hypothetical protein